MYPCAERSQCHNVGRAKRFTCQKVHEDEMSNFAMGTILGEGFPQAKVHTVHSTSACGKPFPKIVLMAKLHSLLACAFIMST